MNRFVDLMFQGSSGDAPSHWVNNKRALDRLLCIDSRIIHHWHSLPLSELGSASVISALTNWPIKFC